MRHSHSALAAALLIIFPRSVCAEIAQDRPELCAEANNNFPLPPGTTAIETVGGVDLTIKLLDGSLRTLELGGPDRIRQVCPLGQNRLLVFGPVAGGDGYIVWILSQADGAVLDVFGARDPRVSPDQHWVVYRERYPTVVEFVIEQYLLYDLTKDAAANQPPRARRQYAPGYLIYPVTANRVRLDDLIVKPEQYHEFASESFFWSPDSKVLVFGDRVAGSTSVVVVDVADKDLAAYVHALNPNEICEGNGLGPEIITGATIARVEFGPTRENLPNIWIHFSFGLVRVPIGTACDKAPQFHSGNLRRAEIENHKR